MTYFSIAVVRNPRERERGRGIIKEDEEKELRSIKI